MEGAGERGGGGAHGVGGPRWFPRELVRREEEDDRMGPPVSEGEREGSKGYGGVGLS